MDLEEIKRILHKDKGKIIIVEEGKPVMIILPYEEQDPEVHSSEEREPFLEEQEMDSGAEELTIDDLPL
ncbi:MAG: hypothetical protein Q8P55_02810 [bacterium]|nr:hypothetical protein [bacterium]